MKLLGVHKPVIGMLHLPPSPGVEGFPGIMAAVETLRADETALLAGGVDALLLENMHDFPCLPEAEQGPELLVDRSDHGRHRSRGAFARIS